MAYRQKLLEKWVPPKYRKKQCAADFVGADEYIDVNPALKKALEVVYREARKEKLIHYGPLAYNKFVEIAGGDKRMPVIYYQLLAQDAGIHAAKIGTEISKVIDNALVHDVFYQQYKDMNQLSYELSIKVGTEQFPVFTITELSRCVPYKYIGGRFYCSIDYLFYELYYQMFHEESRVYEHNVSCLIRYLQRVQQQYYKEKGITELDNSPLQRFVTKCKGPYVDVMRESFYSIWVDRAKARAKITDVLPKGDTIGLTGVKDRPIRVYPVESEQCTGKEEDDCDYPCNWVDKIGKCSGIPVTGYRPGQPGPKKVSGGAVVDLK